LKAVKMMEVAEDGTFYYKTEGGVKYTLRNQETSRIHSCRIGSRPPTINILPHKMKTSTTIMRIHVPNRRYILQTPRMHAHAKNNTTSQGMQNAKARKRPESNRDARGGPDGNNGSLSMSDEYVAQLVIHIVRPHLDEDRRYTRANKSQKETTREPPRPNFVRGEGKMPPGKLDQNARRVTKPPQQLEKAKKNLTDFDAIMRRRKDHTDTIDDTGRLLGALSSNVGNVHAGRTRSRLWSMVRECLKTKSYLKFAGRKMSVSLK